MKSQNLIEIINKVMKYRKTVKITTLLFTVFIMVSCFSKDTQTELEVYTDAYMIKKMEGSQPVYGVIFYAYGNQMMKTGTVTEVGIPGTTINLALSPNSIFTLWKAPTGNDFKPYPPAESEYIFKVTAESGLSNESNDYLKIKNIGIPVITKTAFSDNKKLIDVAWTSVTGADGYLVKVAEENGNIIYSSDGMLPSVTGYTINLLTGNWSKFVETGKNYSIEVHAFAYEADAEEFYQIYNVEEISIGAKSVLYELE